MSERLKVAVSQIAPVWLKRDETLTKIADVVAEAGEANCDLVVFGEALAPGYPFWVERTGGARFDNDVQKDLFAWYSDQAVQPGVGHLNEIQTLCAKHEIAVYLGFIERANDRSGHSLYASLGYIDKKGELASVHRKLVPTYEERLVWSPGDGHGLRTHKLGAFTVGGLNCWENWMPLTRAALHGLGEDLHVAVWPGSIRNTHDITTFLAKEGRSFVISVSGLMRRQDVPEDIPHAALIIQNMEDWLADGGSCIAAPDGSWVLQPEVGVENLRMVHLDPAEVRRARQNFDPSGHYSRPDVTELIVDRRRQQTVRVKDED